VRRNRGRPERWILRRVPPLLVLITAVAQFSEVVALPNVDALKFDEPPASCPDDYLFLGDLPCQAGLVVDHDCDGLVDPGDSFRYVVGVVNSGTTDAINVVFCDTIDFQTVLSGPIRSTPVACNDSYTVQVDVALTVPPSTGVLANDNDPDGQTVIISSVDGASAQGGSVTMEADGGFDYQPPPGFIGVDSFVYRIDDEDGNTDPASVILLVTGSAPSAEAAQSTSYQTAGGPCGQGINLPLGVLNAGQVVSIFLEVMVKDPFPDFTNQVCNQGLIAGDNFAIEFTDDPQTGNFGDATCTDIDLDDLPDLELILGKGPGAGDVTLQWTSTQPPYEVFRSDGPASILSPTNQLGESVETEWVDTPPAGTLYFYNVMASCARNSS